MANVLKNSINPFGAITDLNRWLASNTTSPIYSQTCTCLWSSFHWEFSAFFKFLIFFLTGTSILPGKKKKQQTNHPQKNPIIMFYFWSPLYFFARPSIVIQWLVVLVLQTVPVVSSPEQEWEKTKTTEKLSESACTGLKQCD